MQADEPVPSPAVKGPATEVGQAKHPAADRPSAVWSFLNSNFGIFILSSVALGLISFTYSSWRDYANEIRKIEQLDLEIASRINAIGGMANSKENIRYSNLVNINKVIDGAVDVSFYVRKPIFNEFDSKNLTSLMWQLYLLVAMDQRSEVRQAIRRTNQIIFMIRKVRFDITSEPDDSRPAPKTAKERDKRDDEDDKFKKDYGQGDIFKNINELNETSRWKNLGLRD